MTAEDIRAVVAEARAYAEAHGLQYLPCFKRRLGASADFYPEPLVGWSALALLKRAGVAVDRPLSWCVICRDAPVARADGLCLWCSAAPIGRLPVHPTTAHAA